MELSEKNSSDKFESRQHLPLPTNLKFPLNGISVEFDHHRSMDDVEARITHVAGHISGGALVYASIHNQFNRVNKRLTVI